MNMSGYRRSSSSSGSARMPSLEPSTSRSTSEDGLSQHNNGSSSKVSRRTSDRRSSKSSLNSHSSAHSGNAVTRKTNKDRSESRRPSQTSSSLSSESRISRGRRQSRERRARVKQDRNDSPSAEMGRTVRVVFHLEQMMSAMETSQVMRSSRVWQERYLSQSQMMEVQRKVETELRSEKKELKVRVSDSKSLKQVLSDLAGHRKLAGRVSRLFSDALEFTGARWLIDGELIKDMDDPLSTVIEEDEDSISLDFMVEQVGG